MPTSGSKIFLGLTGFPPEGPRGSIGQGAANVNRYSNGGNREPGTGKREAGIGIRESDNGLRPFG
jgi:hypothetical protein